MEMVMTMMKMMVMTNISLLMTITKIVPIVMIAISAILMKQNDTVVPLIMWMRLNLKVFYRAKLGGFLIFYLKT